MKNSGNIVLPNNINGYLSFKENYKFTVLLYEITEFDNETKSNFKQIEYIRLYNQFRYITNFQPYFNHIFSFYSIFTNFYYLNFNIYIFNKSPLFNKITHQYIDNSGKVRIININFNNTDILIYTTPLPILDVSLLKNYSSTKSINYNEPYIINNIITKKYKYSLIQDLFNTLNIPSYFYNNILIGKYINIPSSLPTNNYNNHPLNEIILNINIHPSTSLDKKLKYYSPK